MSDPSQVALAICQINLSNNEHRIEVSGWPRQLLSEGADLLEIEGLLFRSASR